MKTKAQELFVAIEEAQPRDRWSLGKLIGEFNLEHDLSLTVDEAVMNYHLECKIQKIKPIPIHGV